MLQLININKKYQKGKKEIQVLDNISFDFGKGKFYCIKGVSGAGKTTLIQILGLLLNPSSGSIALENKEIKDTNEQEKARLRNKEIGFIFQNFYLNPYLKAYENVMLPMYLDKTLTKEERKNKAYKLLDLLGLNSRENHFPKELSGGEQQRVAIARALANNPSIILADEPTGSLDDENETKILNILKKLSAEGKCVIMVSHSAKIEEYADIILNLNKGKLEEQHAKIS